jgi:ribosome-binding factor A
VGDVHVSPDGRHARVRVAVRGDDREQKAALAALDHARHYLRHELAGRLSLRHVPELYFELDRFEDSPERVEILLKRAKKSRGRDENHP